MYKITYRIDDDYTLVDRKQTEKECEKCLRWLQKNYNKVEILSIRKESNDNAPTK